MSWSQSPYNPAYSQAGAGGQWGGRYNPPLSQPYNPAMYATQPPPTQSMSFSQSSIPPGGYTQAPPQSYSQAQSSLPPGGYTQAPPGRYTQAPPQSYSQAPSSLPPGGYTQAPPGGYSGPPPSAGQPPGVDPELWGWFQSVDADSSGQITAMELRQALLNSNWSHFNAETCRILIGMFDTNKDGTIDIYEFAALWKYVQEWKGCFDRFDQDKSGNIDANELQQALNAFGYGLSMGFCNLCTRMFDRNDQRTMKFDDFIQCCVMLRSLTESFKRMDTSRSGTITISYEQFLEMAIDNSI